MSISSLLLFAAVYFAAVATPGPGVAALVARVLGHGLTGVAPFILGYVVGDLIWLAIAATGLAAVAHVFAGAFVALRLAGAAYLIYIAWGMARSSFAVGNENAPPPQATRGWRAFSGSLSLTLGNPKVMVFFLSIMPLVVDVKSLTPARLAELMAVCAPIIADRTVMRSTVIVGYSFSSAPMLERRLHRAAIATATPAMTPAAARWT